jgi:outer membrane protein TolC
MKKQSLLFICFSLSLQLAFASDTLRTLSLKDVYGLVLANHPVVRQADAVKAVGEFELMAARGAFDPQLKSAFDEKSFDGKDYWKIWQTSLRVPVWNGIDVKAEYQQTTGSELDPMLLTPSQGLSSAGLSIPLGQGLLIDARRAAVKQAGYMRSMLQAEQQVMINKLFLQVNSDYLEWSLRYEYSRLLADAVRLGAERLENIRYKVVIGEVQALDSVELLIELQNRTGLYLQALNDYRNAGLVLSNHLWDPDGNPVQVDSLLAPEVFRSFATGDSLPDFQSLLELSENHPDILQLDAKYGQAEVEKRWAAEKIRPKLNVEYNVLGSGADIFDGVPDYKSWTDNHKVGITFSTSLFLREERGKYSIAKLKQERIRLETDYRKRQIATDLRTVFNEIGLLRQQLTLQQSQVANAQRLLEGETIRFNEGEGSVFFINTRENALVNSKMKLAELNIKYEKSTARLRWAAGTR